MSRLEGVFLALCAVLAAFGSAAAQDDVLTVVSWGGAYEESQRIAYFDPFTRATGVPVAVERYNGGLDGLRAELADGSTGWDVIDMVDADARAACREGLLAPLDPSIFVAAPDGTPAREDFIDGAFLPCAVVQLVFSTVIAYDERAFPGEKPGTVADLFDLERFPGKRALRKEPVALLEWALMAYGVPRAQIYDLLSTRRGMDLAFRKLDEIRDHIVWWEEGEEPAELLKSGKVAMASGYNGRFFEARAVEGAPVSIVWDGQLLDYDVWAIPRGADQPDLAEDFIRFATLPDRMAEQARHIPYGPARRSAMTRIGLHPVTMAPMREQLPTASHRLDTAIWQDSEWYARTEALRHRLFREWLEEGTGSGAAD
ncbi:ABC transporter substrate-binding protein [Kaustia mangrovi]|uniref:ABC transporter substrate-binding protein n=1 Tax=Kaustia mangrovi TaxID=2593653 RepID=A0A7S8C6B0_9HYPH|nr:ABC transporter substrate-binding protein [Kaustia mangrovi]QPC44184.1 ABC transporter substrate-binding protein [Kaustia mangrovi]